MVECDARKVSNSWRLSITFNHFNHVQKTVPVTNILTHENYPLYSTPKFVVFYSLKICMYNINYLWK